MPGRDLFAGSRGGGVGGRDLFAGSGGGSRTVTISIPQSSRKKKHGHSFWHSVAEPFVNTGKAVAGIGPGLAATGEAVGQDIGTSVNLIRGKTDKHPRAAINKVIIPTAKSYGYKYGPLFHGHVGTTAHRALVEDPFGTAMDIATIATAGAAAPVKAGLLPEASRSFVLRSPAARLGQEGATVTKTIRGSNLSRLLKARTSQVMNRLPYDAPVAGEGARYARTAKAQLQRPLLRDQMKQAPYLKAYKVLNKNEKTAVDLMHDFPTADSLTREAARLEATGGDAQTIALMRNPKVVKLVTNPTPKMERALAESGKLGQESVRMLGLDEQTALQRRYQRLLVQHGAKFQPKPLEGTPEELLGKTAVTAKGGTVRILHVDPEGFLGPGERGPIALVDHGKYRTEIPLRDLHAPGSALTAPAGKTIEGMIQEMQAQGGRQPLYRPHVTIEDKRGTHVGTGGGSYRSGQATIRQSQGILADLGKAIYGQEVLSPAFLRSVKTAHYGRVYDQLLNSGVKVERGYKLRPGEEFLLRKGEKIGHVEKTAGGFDQQMNEILKGLGEDLSTNSPHLADQLAAEDAAGNRIVIPSSLKKTIVGEFKTHGRVFDWFYRKPTNVWRALVLNARPGWLVNNVVGNTLLYAVLHAGPAGLRSYLQAVADTHGVQFVVKKLVDDPKILNRLTPADLAEILPDQVQGVFLESQLPPAGKLGVVTHGKASPLKILRSADVGYEQLLRRAIVNKVLRNSPEARALYKQMPKQERSWREAMKQAAHDPQVVERAAVEANATLGNYLNMTPLEQGAIRSLVPFYGWFRAITQISTHLVIDSPVRANLLYNIGKFGETVQAQGYPFGGAVDLGGGKILKTAGVNPFETIPQIVGAGSVLGRSALGQVPGLQMGPPVDPADTAFAAGGLLNPVAMLPFTGGASSTFRNLPEMQLAFPKKPKHPEKGLYTDYDRMAYLMAYLGAPVRTLRQPK